MKTFNVTQVVDGLSREQRRLSYLISHLMDARVAVGKAIADLAGAAAEQPPAEDVEKQAKPSGRKLSRKARKAISDAQKARWKKQKAQAKK